MGLLLVSVLKAAVFLTALGVVVGFVLSYASKKLEVVHSEIISKLIAALPGINCGACGYGSCKAYAQAVSSGEVCTKCVPGKKEAADKLYQIMEEEKSLSCHNIDSGQK
jgi:Na+-translocating ferredoxin:NAD+ oxidoreductase subunit B